MFFVTDLFWLPARRLFFIVFYLIRPCDYVLFICFFNCLTASKKQHLSFGHCNLTETVEIFLIANAGVCLCLFALHQKLLH